MNSQASRRGGEMGRVGLGLGLLSVVALMASAAQCPQEQACTLEARASLSVHVVTDDGVAVDDADVTARLDEDGATDEVCEPFGDAGDYLCPFFEVEGDFVVTASKIGFISDTRTATVTADVCHVDPATVTLTLVAADVPCCCAFIKPGDFDIISEEPADTTAACEARDQGTCVDPAGRFTPHPCCPDAVGDRCE